MRTTISAYNIEQYDNNKERYQLTLDQKNILKLGNWKSRTSNQANGLTYKGVSIVKRTSNQANGLTYKGVLVVKTNNKWGKILNVDKWGGQIIFHVGASS